MSNDNMTNSGKSLPQSLTEDSSAPGMPPPYSRHGGFQKCYERMMFILDADYWKNCRTFAAQHEHWDNHDLPNRWCDCCDDIQAEYVYGERDRTYALMVKNRNRAMSQVKEKADLGPREFTLTYSPSWYETDEDAQRAMEVAIEKLTRYYKDEIIEFHAIGEFTRDGRAHVHGWYNLNGGRKITDKNFKRAWKHWNPKRKLGKGFEGGHHQTIQRVSDFSGYTEKHLDEAWLNIHINNGPQEVNVPTLPQEVHSPSSDDTQDSS